MKRYNVLSGVSQRTGDPDIVTAVFTILAGVQSGAAWIFSL